MNAPDDDLHPPQSQAHKPMTAAESIAIDRAMEGYAASTLIRTGKPVNWNDPQAQEVDALAYKYRAELVSHAGHQASTAADAVLHSLKATQAHSSTADQPRDAAPVATAKAFSNLAALYALAGWQFWRTDAADGPQRFFAARWGRVTEPMADLVEAEQFLARVTGKPA